MKTLKELQDYFSTTDNTYVQHKLKLLEIEIEKEIIKAKMAALNETISIVEKRMLK